MNSIFTNSERDQNISVFCGILIETFVRFNVERAHLNECRSCVEPSSIFDLVQAHLIFHFSEDYCVFELSTAQSIAEITSNFII